MDALYYHMHVPAPSWTSKALLEEGVTVAKHYAAGCTFADPCIDRLSQIVALGFLWNSEGVCFRVEHKVIKADHIRR